jgi:hypothetical protein
MSTTTIDKSPTDEKHADIENDVTDISIGFVEPFSEAVDIESEKGQIFKQVKDGVNFRTVGWKKASIIFLKGKCSCKPT